MAREEVLKRTVSKYYSYILGHGKLRGRVNWEILAHTIAYALDKKRFYRRNLVKAIVFNECLCS